ncbi:MAG: DUF1559 domain-containing protein [Planctomycetales bacterium]|jgi:hypothetical protein
MEHGFPPTTDWTSISPATIVAHVTMLLLVFGSIGGLFLTRKRTASSADIWIWAAVILSAPLGATVAYHTLDYFGKGAAGPFLVGYVLFTWLVSFTGIARSHRSLNLQQKSSPMGCSIACLVTLGLLIMFSLPAVPQVREAARRSQCKNNLKQLGLALSNYADIYEAFPASQTGTPPMSWRVGIASYIDSNDILETYDETQTWDSLANESVAKRRCPVYACPSRRSPIGRADRRGRILTDYAMTTGDGTLANLKSRTPAGITDGTSNTLAIVEASGLNIVWTEPRDAQVDREPLGINFKGTGKSDSPGLMSSWHVGGAQAAFADGTVRFISQDIDPGVLKALTTVNGGESVEGWDAP